MTHLTRNRELPAVRAPAAAGLAYSAAWIVALAIWPSNPSVDASAAQVMAAFGGHEGAAIAQYALAQGVAAGALAVVVLAVAGATPRRLGRAVAAAGLAAVSISVVQLVLGVVLAASAVPAGSTGRALGLFEAINRLDGVKMLALAAMAAAGTAAGRGVLPRWLGRVAAVLAVALVASGAGYLLLNATLAQAAYVSLPLLLVWVTGTGLVLGRSMQR
jgi:hypothetical protein